MATPRTDSDSPQGPVEARVPSGSTPTSRPALDTLDSLMGPAHTVPADLALDPEAPELAPDLRLLDDEDDVPTEGWRRAVYRMSFGLIRPGVSSAALEDRHRVERMTRTVSRPMHVAFICFKGGVGKTSTASGVMLTMAQHRGDGVVVADFNPDTGDLSERLLGEQKAAVFDFAQVCGGIQRRGDLGQWLSTRNRLAVLPGETDPSPDRALTQDNVHDVLSTLQRYYSVIGMDAGTGFALPAMGGLLANADVAVVCASYSLTGARRAVDTLEWLRRHGHERLADRAVIALADKDRTSQSLSKDRVVRWLDRHTNGLVVVPSDPHVADGRELSLEALQPATRRAYAEIAALVGEAMAEQD